MILGRNPAPLTSKYRLSLGRTGLTTLPACRVAVETPAARFNRLSSVSSPTLWKSLYLLAADRKGWISIRGSALGRVVRAGVLAELYLAGELVDREDRPEVAHIRSHVSSSLEARIIAEIENSRPRRWFDWIVDDDSATARLARDQLIVEGLLRPHKRWMVGVDRLADLAVRSGIVGTVVATLDAARQENTQNEARAHAAELDAVRRVVAAEPPTGEVRGWRQFRESRRRMLQQVLAESAQVRAKQAPSCIDESSATLVGLAGAGKILDRGLQGQYRDEIALLVQRAGPVAMSLRSAS
jgi:Golgi phosphoprotein 3 GPP34